MRLAAIHQYRVAVCIDNTAGATGTKDAQLNLDLSAAWFWETVLSTGYDVRFAAADGVTPIAHKRTAWSYAGRTATLELSAVSVTASSTCVVWMYWGDATASDGATSPAIASPATAYVHMGLPSLRAVEVVAEAAGATTTRGRAVKTATEARWLWWDVEGTLERLPQQAQGSLRYEEVSLVTYSVLDAAEAAQASMVDATRTVVAVDGLVGTWIKAGSEGDYMATLTITTSLGRVLEGRCQLTIQAPEV